MLYLKHNNTNKTFICIIYKCFKLKRTLKREKNKNYKRNNFNSMVFTVLLHCLFLSYFWCVDVSNSLFQAAVILIYFNILTFHGFFYKVFHSSRNKATNISAALSLNVCGVVSRRITKIFK